VQGLGEALPAPNRMELVRTPGDLLVLNDAYNSSPTSAAAAVRALEALHVTGRRIAVLGEMRELGADALDEHRALGALVAECGVDVLIAVGSAARPIADGAAGGHGTVITVPNAEAASAAVAEHARAGDAVLVKASRVVGLEQVVEALERGTVAR
jgi:UDP-N-acetylmuramoyl-tripeptide--D-alanyl-D-alanine ligase